MCFIGISELAEITFLLSTDPGANSGLGKLGSCLGR